MTDPQLWTLIGVFAASTFAMVGPASATFPRRTSVFPDKVRGFVLPVKKAVRRAESLDVGDSARVRLALLG